MNDISAAAGGFSGLITTATDPLEVAFPEVVPFLRPLGNNVLVQLRRPPRKIGGGLIITTDDARMSMQYDTQIGKVLAMGPGAFRNRTTGEPWPETAEDGVVLGDYVRLPRAGMDRWLQVVNGEKDDPVMLALVKDLDIKGVWTGSPLHIDTAKSGW